ncbi:SAM-dependent methyltransferase [Saccharothrix sp. AJ9571]|nr:SAM-dependent methyltransferase [Saccharothrix sp. AJ9571]
MTEPRAHLGCVLSAQFSNGNSTAADRAVITGLRELWPELFEAVSHGNDFECRLVTAAHNAGIHQFVFLGHGYPSASGPVFQATSLAEADPPSIVVVESNPEIEKEWRAAHTRFPKTYQVSDRDRWAADSVLDDLPAHGIDLTQPLCLVLGNAATYNDSVEHAHAQLARYQAALPPGSWMALSHLTAEHTDGTAFAVAASVFERLTGAVPTSRTRDEVAGLFGGWPLLSPGVCAAQEWLPDSAESARVVPGSVSTWCGVACRPATRTLPPHHGSVA